jgi:hypothetical protein
VFPKQWWAVAIAWFVVAWGLLTWNMVRLRRARQQAGVSPPSGQSNAAFLRRIAPSFIVAGAGFILLGATWMTLARGGPTTAHLVGGSVLLVVGAATLIWASLLRFRRPSGDSSTPPQP